MWNYDIEKKIAEEYARIRKEKAEISALRHQYDKPKKELTMGKKLTIFALADCIVIQLFSMFAMIYMHDISAIYSLIAIVGSIFAEVFSLISYNHKSMRENTEGGINYQDMMNEYHTCTDNTEVIMGSGEGGTNDNS